MTAPHLVAKDSETLANVVLRKHGQILMAYEEKEHVRTPIDVLAREAAEWEDGTRKVDKSWVRVPWPPPAPMPTPMPDSPRMYEEYRHYKGGLYRVFSLAWDVRHNHWAVVYVSAKDGGWWIRPIGMWFERVEHEGRSVARFTRQ